MDGIALSTTNEPKNSLGSAQLAQGSLQPYVPYWLY
jgi:hypothetical protein